MRSATVAAVEVAEEAGLAARDPVLLHETNNTVVWLRPEPVIAKVGTRPAAATDLRVEHAVATELAAAAPTSVHRSPTLCRRCTGRRGSS